MTEPASGGSVTTIDEKNELRSTARKFFEKHSGEAAVRIAMETADGFDRALWLAMANELGLQGLAIPDEFGGAGFSFSDLQIVLEEMGRTLFRSITVPSAPVGTTCPASPTER